MVTSQHSQTRSTCPFDARKLPTEKPDARTSMQGTTTNSPATGGLQRWTTSTWSSQAAHCRHPDVLNEVTFPRNNLSWTVVENHTSTHEVAPMVQSNFFLFPLGFATKMGRRWEPWLMPPRPWEKFGSVRVISGCVARKLPVSASMWLRVGTLRDTASLSRTAVQCSAVSVPLVISKLEVVQIEY
jgi:hypothetical protein